jgi:hypothetical protein
MLASNLSLRGQHSHTCRVLGAHSQPAHARAAAPPPRTASRGSRTSAEGRDRGDSNRWSGSKQRWAEFCRSSTQLHTACRHDGKRALCYLSAERSLTLHRPSTAAPQARGTFFSASSFGELGVSPELVDALAGIGVTKPSHVQASEKPHTAAT